MSNGIVKYEEWNCKICTFLNNFDLWACTMCSQGTNPNPTEKALKHKEFLEKKRKEFQMQQKQNAGVRGRGGGRGRRGGGRGRGRSGSGRGRSGSGRGRSDSVRGRSGRGRGRGGGQKFVTFLKIITKINASGQHVKLFRVCKAHN